MFLEDNQIAVEILKCNTFSHEPNTHFSTSISSNGHTKGHGSNLKQTYSPIALLLH